MKVLLTKELARDNWKYKVLFKKQLLLFFLLIICCVKLKAQSVADSVLVTMWEKQESESEWVLMSIYFIGKDTGYVVGSNGTILKTLNSGQKWKKQESGTNETLKSVCFTDANVGYIVGSNGIILKTTNGGEKWAIQISGSTDELNSVIFIDNDTGYIAGKLGTFLKTTNGGKKWDMQTTGYLHSLNSVFFTDADNGFIVGSYGLILKTIDGGKFWTKAIYGINIPHFPGKADGEIFSSVFFTDKNTGYTVGNDFILKTTNGGDTWTSEQTHNFFLRSVFFKDSSGYAVGQYGIIVETKNRGSSWKLQKLKTGERLNSVYCTNRNKVYIVGDNGTILTSKEVKVSIESLKKATDSLSLTYNSQDNSQDIKEQFEQIEKLRKEAEQKVIEDKQKAKEAELYGQRDKLLITDESYKWIDGNNKIIREQSFNNLIDYSNDNNSIKVQVFSEGKDSQIIYDRAAVEAFNLLLSEFQTEVGKDDWKRINKEFNFDKNKLALLLGKSNLIISKILLMEQELKNDKKGVIYSFSFSINAVRDIIKFINGKFEYNGTVNSNYAKEILLKATSEKNIIFSIDSLLRDYLSDGLSYEIETDAPRESTEEDNKWIIKFHVSVSTNNNIELFYSLLKNTLGAIDANFYNVTRNGVSLIQLKKTSTGPVKEILDYYLSSPEAFNSLVNLFSDWNKYLKHYYITNNIYRYNGNDWNDVMGRNTFVRPIILKRKEFNKKEIGGWMDIDLINPETNVAIFHWEDILTSAELDKITNYNIYPIK